MKRENRISLVRLAIALLFVIVSIAIGCGEATHGNFDAIDWEYARSRIGEWMNMLGWAWAVWFVFGEFSEALKKHWWSSFLIYYFCAFAKTDSGLLHELAFLALPCFAGFGFHHWLSNH